MLSSIRKKYPNPEWPKKKSIFPLSFPLRRRKSWRQPPVLAIPPRVEERPKVLEQDIVLFFHLLLHASRVPRPSPPSPSPCPRPSPPLFPSNFVPESMLSRRLERRRGGELRVCFLFHLLLLRVHAMQRGAARGARAKPPVVRSSLFSVSSDSSPS